MTSIDRVQDAVDKLVLELFEVVRGHSDTTETPEDKAAKLTKAYTEALASVDDLLGIEKSKEEQEAYLEQASKEYEELKGQVLALEKNVRTLGGQVDQELEQVTTISFFSSLQTDQNDWSG